ncbi:hypothetical protein ASPWEDRAFT_105068 [Aspergillus wentii DTO 134E9]|uniref:Rhodopsin domain-containing protein n=1 Tax=Aspergillus wentii DTO 134E9 TaxID=1073089 RepID=A0A1L9RT69_ASPWE|nr:uncharacterized protein ASPWEDRAFT_105068 [Aspergillus wentii DTO 134E9]KAI9933775.1 hypothetical protein MW887_004847 [Aspergillus wentii]OJJ38120.1 hypothetical protein ASPWEDRAFT_105068 [Aspergillus wentii DTO 134E9]
MAGDAFATEAFTLLALAIVIIVLRTGARLFTAGVRNLQLDDYLMPLAGVVYGLETGAAYCVGAWWMGLANNSMTDEQRKNLDPASKEYQLRVGGSKTQVIGWSLYTTLLWLLKGCMAVFYSRLTAGLQNLTLRVRIAHALIGATYIAVICSILFGCHPMQKNWQIYPDPGNYCQPAVSHIDVYVTVTLNVATDLYLITIPTPMLWKARLPWREKIELLVLFSGGLFVMMAGILRCVLIVTAGANGAQQAGSWACRETFVAVVIGNIPMIYPVCRRAARRAGIYISSRGGTTEVYHVYPLSEDQQPNTDNSNGRRRKFRHPLSIPGDTQWNTISGDEQMILPTSRQHPPTCTADPERDWETNSTLSQEGIKVVMETIVRSDMKERK